MMKVADPLGPRAAPLAGVGPTAAASPRCCSAAAPGLRGRRRDSSLSSAAAKPRAHLDHSEHHTRLRSLIGQRVSTSSRRRVSASASTSSLPAEPSSPHPVDTAHASSSSAAEPQPNPIVADIRRKLPYWGSDFSDGLHPQAVAAVAFLAFACLTPCIAFGSLTAAQTGGAIGVVETVLGTAMSGIIYAVLSGQPLTLLGPTGLVVVFTGLLFKAANSLALPFLPVYGWVSVWSAAFLLILAAAGTSDLIHYFTRFTDDTFSALISLGFISEACKSLVRQFAVVPAASAAAAATAVQNISTPLLSALVAVSTWFMATLLAQLRNTQLLVAPLRNFLSDFGPPLAILSMSLLPRLVFPNVALPTLAPPMPPASEIASSGASQLAAAFATTSGRPWLVQLGSLPAWAIAACSVPAALLTLLVFLDQNITTRLLDAPENGLRKGCGYHLDLAILAALMILSGLIGTPWMVASTVPSLAHVRSLALTRAQVTALEAKSKGNGAPASAATAAKGGVRENRITGLAIHVAVGGALLLLPLLAFVPSAVAQGLFIFMGISGLAGNQLVERLKLWIWDPVSYPKLPSTEGVPVKAVHLFTLIQASCLGLLWQLKHSKWGIFFPLLILALMPIRRYLAPLWFSESDLAVLDSH